MAMLKTNAVQGEALVFGRALPVVWSQEDGATISGVSHEEFLRLLDLLAGVNSLPLAPSVTTTPVPAAGATTPAKLEKRADVAPGEQQNLPVPPAPVAKVEPPPKSPPDAHVPAGAVLPPDAMEFPPSDGGVPDSIKKAGRMLDIVNWLMERGVVDAVAMVRECERIKPDVPFLARVADMEKRVERTLAAYHGR